MIPIRLTARSAETEYLPLVETPLSARVRQDGGSGAADDPYRYEVEVRNSGSRAWAGVIRADLSFGADDPRFFLPSFLYGTNRGEAPLVTDSQAPPRRSFPRRPGGWCAATGFPIRRPLPLRESGSSACAPRLTL